MSLSSFAAMSAGAREQEIQILLELVRLSRLTLLVAEAGSDKSSVLRSRVMPLLRDLSSGSAKEIPVLFDWWKKAPLLVLNARIDEALARVVGDAAYAIGDHADRLCARLAARQQDFDCTFTIILDRFEEYLQAPADDLDVREFEAQLVEAVNSPTVRANFVLSVDEFATPQLDRLRERIPGLGDARVRLSSIQDNAAVAGRADSRQSSGQLVGSEAPPARSAAPGARSGEDDAAGPPALEEVNKNRATQRTIEALFQPPRPSYRHAATLRRRAESSAVQDNTHTAAAAAQPGASAPPPSHDRVPGPRHELQQEIAGVPEAIAPSAMLRERHEQATPPTAFESQPPIMTAGAAEAPPQSSFTRTSVLIVVVIAMLSSVALLATRRGAAPAPDAAALPPSKLAAENDTRADRHEEAHRGRPAAQAGGAPLNAQEAHGASEGLRNSNETGASPPEGAPIPGTLPPGAVAASDASESEVAVEKSTTSAPPPLSLRAAERASPVAAHAASPLLYIHVGSEAQRAYAESLIKPLARHGIRVSGIRVVSVGPPASDLRYFHSVDHADALRINRALDLIGKPAQRVNHVRGFEDRKPRSEFELWLPAIS